MKRDLFKSSDPRQPFYVINRVELTPAKERVLTRLYQPLIGANAQALYLTLAYEYNALPINSNYQPLVQLQEQTGLSLPAIFDALHNLEAVSLVSTYLGQNQVLGQVIKIKLSEIPSAASFFNEFLLSSLLREKVGDEGYQRLRTDFQTSVMKTAQDQDVSASFFDVFHLSQADLANLPAGRPRKRDEGLIKRASIKVDWQLLEDLLSKAHLPAGEVDKHRREIQQVMGFYHYSEEQFADLAASTFIPGKESLDFKKIENAAGGEAQDKQAASLRHRLTQKPDQVLAKLDAKDQALLKQALTLPPLEFLTKVKQGKGGYVAAQERRIIFNLQNRTGLTPELVNMVSYTALRYDSILTQQRADRIANSWLEHGVTTAAGAIAFIKDYEQKARQRRSGGYRQAKRVEQGTDWSKKQAKTDSSLSMADLKKMLGGKNDHAGNQ